MPYPNEHSCRLEDPDKIKKGTYGRKKREHEGKQYDVIYGVHKEKDSTVEQAYRYNTKTWSKSEAKSHCKDHDGDFHPAKKEKEKEEKEQEYPAIIDAICSEVWAILPDKLNIILNFLNARISGDQISEDCLPQAPQPSPSQQGSIALLPLYGTVTQRMGLMTALSGGTSTDRFGAALNDAMNDPKVSSVLVDVDSPGGTVYGVQELSKKIYNARKKKPVYAIANSMAASAAYWIASAATELFVMPGGDVGSIGVYAVHSEQSGFDEKMGIKRTVLRAGKYKAEGNPYEPLNEKTKEYAQDRLNERYNQFLKDVSRNRGVSINTARNDFGQGRLLNARDALSAGMVDGIKTFEQTVNYITRNITQKRNKNKLALHKASLTR